MKSTLIWFILLGAILLLGDAVHAWNRQFFNRYSRNFFRNAPVGNTVGVGDINTAPMAGAGRASNNEIDELNALFGNANANNVDGSVVDGNVGIMGGVGGYGIGQQQTEVYGIVEPLIEDTPCVDRPCNANDDCCPTGVCVNTYGEGKCIYVYGRKRDLCHRNTDCEAGMACVKGAAGNMICQVMQTHVVPNMNALAVGGGGGIGVGVGVGGVTGVGAAKAFEVHQFGEDCVSSSDCNVAKGMCCQLQRSRHRMMPKKMCAYFRDPFMCIDIMPTEDEVMRESRFHSVFSQRHM